MPDILLTDTINVTGKILDASFELAPEQDILLADYDQAVFKIVKTNVEHTITSKHINGTKLIIEGFFRISVYYQPPQGATLTVITKKQTFQKQIDVNTAVTGPYFVLINGDLQYVNTRAINSNRISVSGVYGFNVRVYTQQTFDLTTAINSTTVCTDSEEITSFSLCGRGIRQFSMEDEISMPQETEKILNITATNKNMTIIPYTDKVNVKGEVLADIVYTLNNSQQIHHLEKTYLYNQVVDVANVTENSAVYGSLSIIGFTVTQNPQAQNINCIFTAQLDINAFRKENAVVVLDGFSKEYEYTKNNSQIIFDENISSVDRNIRFTLEDDIGTNYTPVHHFVTATSPILQIVADKAILLSQLTVSVIVKNQQNEYECFTKTEKIEIETGVEVKPEYEYILECQITESNILMENDVMKAAVNISVKGFVIKHKQLVMLSEFIENTEKPLSETANKLILYYGQQGEKIFDIGLRYRTDTAIIMSENSLEDKVLPEDKMLFIPAFGL